MFGKKEQGYGTWSSPITGKLVGDLHTEYLEVRVDDADHAADGRDRETFFCQNKSCCSQSQPHHDTGTVYFSERRGSEGGRTVVSSCTHGGAIRTWTVYGHSVETRVNAVRHSCVQGRDAL